MMKSRHHHLLIAISCLAAAACGEDAPGDPDAAGAGLSVDFDDGSFGPLSLNYGPRDPPTPTDPAYTVRVALGQAVLVAPAAAPGPRLSGFLDLPPTAVPIAGPMSFAWTFPAVADLLALGGTAAGAVAVAGCYVRGDVGAWQGGTIGDYWFGFVRAGEVRLSAIRQGNTNLTSEPFSAATTATYRLEKDGRRLRLFVSYDGAPFHQVGTDVVLMTTPGGSEAVYTTHVRVLDLTGTAISVRADDFRWTW